MATPGLTFHPAGGGGWQRLTQSCERLSVLCAPQGPGITSRLESASNLVLGNPEPGSWTCRPLCSLSCFGVLRPVLSVVGSLCPSGQHAELSCCEREWGRLCFSTTLVSAAIVTSSSRALLEILFQAEGKHLGTLSSFFDFSQPSESLIQGLKSFVFLIRWICISADSSQLCDLAQAACPL